MPEVSAVNVWPTRAAPLMLGAPVAGLLGGGPNMTLEAPTNSILPSSVHTAPAASQSASGDSDTVTMASVSGVNRTSHRSLRSSTRLTATVALVTSRAWSRSPSGVADTASLNDQPEGERRPGAAVARLRQALEPRRQRLRLLFLIFLDVQLAAPPLHRMPPPSP